MDIFILTQEAGLTKYFRATIDIPYMKKEFPMMKLIKMNFDTVSSKERLKTPFSYKWLKFKTNLLSFTLKRGMIYDPRSRRP